MAQEVTYSAHVYVKIHASQTIGSGDALDYEEEASSAVAGRLDRSRTQAVGRGEIEEVKVDRLARKMKVTRGSFYWHFKNRKDLLDSVLRVWEAHKERELQQTRAQWATMGPLEVVRIWLSEDPTYPAFDIAIRFWAWKAPAVAKIVSAIDNRWIAFLAEQFFGRGRARD